jgi:iron complex outermembrane receptor protein
MSKLLLLLAFLIAPYFLAFSQGEYSLTGRVVDDQNKPLPGSSVVLYPIKKGTTTDSKGYFTIASVKGGNYALEISFMGYYPIIDSVSITSNLVYNARLKAMPITLQEVIVVDHYAERVKREESLNVDIVNSQFIKHYQSGSLMKTLERIPGVSTIDIGAGQSKPIIRGLSFNRVVVVDNGIKHEGQQWGADHGLEIDQYAVSSVEVVKGPASLMYGSDAIGGAIVLKSNGLPQENSLAGTVDLLGKTNNNLWGTSVNVLGRKNGFWGGFRATVMDYADYKVPTDSIDIYSY